MKRRFALVAVPAAIGLAIGSYALAAQGGEPRGPNSVRGPMNGYQEVPSISTTGKGLFTARIDERAREIRWTLSWRNLENPALQAHVHFGQRAVNGGISAFLCTNLTNAPPPPAAPTQACPTTPSGQVSGVIRPNDVVGPSAQGIEPGSWDELVRAIRVGHTYANIHTSRWPAGEIRGQIHDHDQKEFVR